MSGEAKRPPLSRWKRVRLRLARAVYPFWTEYEAEAIKWRAHQDVISLGFQACHRGDEPCPARPVKGSPSAPAVATHSLDSRCTVQGCPDCDHAPGVTQ